VDQEHKSKILDTGLAGKSVLVTGAAGEIGRAITAHFVAADARVLMVDRDRDMLEACKADWGDAVICHAADVADAEEMATAVDAAVSAFGGLDVAALNAGIEGSVQSIIDYDIDEFDRVMAVNVRGVWLGLKFAAAAMKAAQRGSIVATASAVGVVGGYKCSAYVASKHAVVGMVRAAAADLGRDGIRVNAVAPGQVEGRMIQALEAGYMPDDTARVRRSMERNMPLGRYAKGSEIAAMVAFLAGDGASFCTGGIYATDGGMTAVR